MAPWQFSDDIHAAVLLVVGGREPRGCAGWVGREVGAAATFAWRGLAPWTYGGA